MRTALRVPLAIAAAAAGASLVLTGLDTQLGGHTTDQNPRRNETLKVDTLWNTPDASVYQSPAHLVQAAVPDAGTKTRLRVVTVSNIRGHASVGTATVDGTAAAQSAVAHAQDDPAVVSVSLDSPVSLTGSAPLTPSAPVAAATPGASAPAVSNDTLRTQQWALDALQAESVWRHASGTGAIVAVVDTGVAGTQPDLAGQLLPGAEFISGGGQASTGNGQVDPNSHGTHVAGIIAAIKGNGLGVAGLAPTASILPVRVLSADGTGWNSDVAAGIIWATDHGANIINLSLGGVEDDTTGAAVAYAINRGVLVVSAAGNERQDGDAVSYPAAFPGVLGVAATTSATTDASYSNTGSYVDIAAPGTNIMSTLPAGYGLKSGTSMAAPFVAAAAADVYDASDGRAGGTEIAAALTNTATDLGAVGRDDVFGAGLIDPLAAVCEYTACTAPLTAPPVPGRPGATNPTPLNPAPGPQVVPARAATRLVVSPPRTYVWLGSKVTIKARLMKKTTGQPLSGQMLVVRGYQGAKVTFTRKARTGATGQITVSATMRRSTSIKVSFAQTPAYAPTHATAGNIRVLPRVRATYRGRTASVTVTPLLHQRVQFQRRTIHGWVTLRTAKLNAHGSVHVIRLAPGSWRVHICRAPLLEDVYTSAWRSR